MDSAFEIEFEELPLEIDGREAGMFWGTAHFDRTGACVQIDISAEDGSIVELKPTRTSLDKHILFRLIHAVLLRRCALRIVDTFYDYHHSSREQHIVDMAHFMRSE